MDNTEQFTAIEWCAGYGGIHLGLKRAIPNLRVIAYGEIEGFACANLVAKMEAGLLDAAPIWTDIKTFPCREFRDRVGLLVAGYPCQPFSAAGKRLGTEDPRHLWPHIARAIRVIRPQLCFFENVEGHISLGLREVVGELESIGYATAWGIFSASEVGAPHQRKRVFILAVSNSLGGAAGLSRSLAWNERLAGVADHGGGEGCGDVENPDSRGNGDRPAYGCGEIEVGSESLQQEWEVDGYRPQPPGRYFEQTPWPSRPGELQHGWEPPRVVDSAGARQQAQQDESLEQRRPDAVGESSELGNAADTRRAQSKQSKRHEAPFAGSMPTNAAWPETQPPLGRDADGPAGGLGYAELCVSCDNRTDELRLLGNGVVPATAERAFRILMEELMRGQNYGR